jgi:hypothetical protein
VRRGVATLLDGVDDFRAIGEASDGSEAAGPVGLAILGRHAVPSVVEQFRQAGALGYVLTQSASTELFAAIRAAAAGQPYAAQPKCRREFLFGEQRDLQREVKFAAVSRKHVCVYCHL